MAKKRSDPPPNPRTEYNIDARAFVEAWQRSSSAVEVSKRLGMPKPIVHARASMYRKAGVKLKKMPRGSKRSLDIEGLNTLIESLKSELEPLSAEAKSKSKTQQANPNSVQKVVEQVENILNKTKE